MDAANGRIARVTVEFDGASESRPAVAYPRLTGPVQVGDDVVVNVGAGRISASAAAGTTSCTATSPAAWPAGRRGHVMKLNYTSLQHAVQPLEEGSEREPPAGAPPAAVLALHGQLPCAAFAFTRMRRERGPGTCRRPGARCPVGCRTQSRTCSSAA